MLAAAMATTVMESFDKAYHYPMDTRDETDAEFVGRSVRAWSPIGYRLYIAIMNNNIGPPISCIWYILINFKCVLTGVERHLPV